MEKREDYFQKLVELMDTLRSPGGCPWDIEQTRETLKPMLIEEAHEVLEALDSNDPDALCEELGDLLFQVIFHSRIAKEEGEFDAYEVCKRVYEKMVGRHPHVFGDASINDSAELLRNWEDIKAKEMAASGKVHRIKESMMDGIPESLPASYTTFQITSKAARVGFDWPDIDGIKDKFLEEFEELKEALDSKDDVGVKEEVGDLLFAALNIARYLEIDPETALKGTNRKFIARFKELERTFEDAGRELRDVSLEEMEEVWQSNKGNVPRP
ncbi:MAG: nucleoside triphosphate pyrophosphohydrolase [Candidatus Bathyarchaeota archaeon]|nr:nucleoside triphosphate pyrophosphohydrolase [Candidatus Bathyarchaeota archaeon]